jgi:Cu-processing system permease protein
MTAVWVIAKHNLRECARRRVFLLIPIATVGFLGLFALGTHFAFVSARSDNFGNVPIDRTILTGATLVGLSMFVTLFMASSLGIFLTFATVRGDAEQGILQAFVVRPVARSGLVLGRFIGTSVVCILYALFLYATSVLITWVIGGWTPDPLLLPGLAIVAAVEVVIVLSLLGSALLSALPNGIGMFMLYGAGLLAGLLGQLGEALRSPALETTGRVVAWALPFEALYQSGLDLLTADTGGLTRIVVELGPLGGAEAGGVGLAGWSFVYVLGIGAACLTLFARRDL